MTKPEDYNYGQILVKNRLNERLMKKEKTDGRGKGIEDHYLPFKVVTNTETQVSKGSRLGRECKTLNQYTRSFNGKVNSTRFNIKTVNIGLLGFIISNLRLLTTSPRLGESQVKLKLKRKGN